MPAYAPKIARRVVRLMLAAILLLNTAAIGAMELQSSLLSPSGHHPFSPDRHRPSTTVRPSAVQTTPSLISRSIYSFGQPRPRA
jgi:hypothetical protein